MKKSALSIVLLLNLLAGCDETPAGPPQPKFPAPAEIGNGKVFLFQANSDEDFHNRLNDFFEWNKQYRMSNIRDMSNNKWIVIVETVYTPTPPSTMPADFGIPNAQGEIKY